MYKILIKYTSTFKKTFWYTYEVAQEDGTYVEFSTSDLEILKAEVDKLDKQIGYENIRIVNDITYEVLVDITETSGECNHEIATTSDIDEIYNTAFNNIYGN